MVDIFGNKINNRAFFKVIILELHAPPKTCRQIKGIEK